MILTMIVRISLRALLRNKMRSFLTMLGIIIGVATVITMLAIGTGARESVEASISSLGTNVMFLMAGSQRQGVMRTGNGTQNTLTVLDLKAIQRECPAVLATSPMVGDSCQIVYENQNWNTNVRGASPEFVIIRAWGIASGRFFQDDDVRSAAKVCVLGRVVVRNLFGNVDPLEKTVRIKHVPFRVIGVLAEKGDAGFGNSQDDTVVIPYTTSMKRVTRRDRIYWSMVSARSPDLVDRAQKQITELMRQRHKIQPKNDDDFAIRTQADIAKAADQSATTFTYLLGGIASISLLVGGIGIMNIMLVSVTERIREIGVRMALGARGRDILWQFLVESMVLSLAGGLLGIGLGYTLAKVAARFTEMHTVIAPGAVVMSFLFSSAVGIFFGLYPAVKAAQLDPIEALRHE